MEEKKKRKHLTKSNQSTAKHNRRNNWNSGPHIFKIYVNNKYSLLSKSYKYSQSQRCFSKHDVKTITILM